MDDYRLEISLDDEPSLTHKDDGNWDTHRFSAKIHGKEVAHITIDRLIKAKDPNLIGDEFYFDSEGKPRPYLFYMQTEEEYQGFGIAGKVILFANKYFQDNFEVSLYSGTLNDKNPIRVWEKLVESRDAFETSYQGDRRWGLF